MKTNNFEDLADKNYALMDATSVSLLHNALKALNLQPNRFSKAQKEHIFTTKYLKSEFNLHHALDVLARMTIYDKVAVDQNALQSIGITSNPFSDFINIIEIPNEVYSRAVSNIQNYRSNVAKHNIKSVLWTDEGLKGEHYRTLFSGTDKTYHDNLFRNSPLQLTSFAESNESLARTLFYFELANMASLPVLLSPGKRDWFDIIPSYIKPEAFELVEKSVDKIMMQKVKNSIEGAYNNSFEVSSPPLVEYIVRTARLKSISLLESAIEIRESEQAKEFRRWTAKLQKQLINGERTNLIEFEKEIRKVNQAAEKWAEYNTNVGITHDMTKLKLKAIPVIGWVFELFGKEEKEIKDPILTSPPSYLTFISNWYKEVENKE